MTLVTGLASRIVTVTLFLGGGRPSELRTRPRGLPRGKGPPRKRAAAPPQGPAGRNEPEPGQKYVPGR